MELNSLFSRPGARDLTGHVVVVTGASSGIGRAAALAFADRGVNVVAIARTPDPLEEVVNECRHRGVSALGVTADVADAAALETAAQAAVDRFGRLDIWVNNAGVAAFGTFEATPLDVSRRIVETNLMGVINGTRAALGQFRAHGGRGTLINTASVDGKIGAAYQAVYSATKFGVVGFGESLRQELRTEGLSVDVCTVLPASIATPLFEHAANYTGRKLNVLNPVYPARQVAETIVACAERPRRQAYVGSVGRTMQLMKIATPGIFDRVFSRQIKRDMFDAAKAAPNPGNVFDSRPPRTDPITGDWDSRTGRVADIATYASAGLVLLASAILLRRSRD